MLSFILFVLVSFTVIELNAQYNSPSPYDRDRTDQPPYDRQNPPHDRQNQYDRNNQYDRQNPPPFGYERQNPPYYDRNNPPPYDRNQPYNQYNQSHYGQYGNGSRDPYYNGSRDPYYNGSRDPYNNGSRDPYNNRDRYDNNRNQYIVGNRDQPYGGNRDQYDRNRDQYSGNRDQYDRNRDQYGGNRDQYDRNRDQYGGNRDQYGNRDQFGNNRDQYGHREPYDRNRDQYNTGNQDDRYGQPLFENTGDCCQEYCYSKDEQPYVNFATKTAYQIVFGKASNQHRIPDCTPIQFWSINRHGTKFPSARNIDRLRQLNKIHDQIIRNYEEKRSFPDRGRLCPEDLDLLKRWRWNETVNERNANSLTSQGIMDLKYLARRYSSRFEELMREPYSENLYSFQYTDSDKTHDSYQAYIEGLFKDKAYQVHANVFNNDRLIKPSKSCEAWKREVEDNPRTLDEYMKFKNKQEYRQMIRDVFRRLGFRYTLNDSVLDDMYDLCRYEKAWNLDQLSPWCVVFTKEQLKLLEYAEDLKYFYKGGYGNPRNKQVGCPPVKDLYEKFERTVNNGGNVVGNKVTVFFTNSITVQTFLTAMGIAKDYQPLTADNYFQQQRRQWRTSNIDPFASNLAAVLYQCRTGERFRAMFFLNEVPVNYPDCSVGLCNWSTVQNKLRTTSEYCNLDFCDRSSSPTLQRNYILYLISIIAIFVRLRF